MNLSKRLIQHMLSVIAGSTLFLVLFLYMDSSDRPISYDLEDQLQPKDISKGRDMKPHTLAWPSLRDTGECYSLQPRHNICNTLPNFFLHKDRQGDFKDAIINFWHMQKTGGSSIETCLRTLYEERNYPSPFNCMASCKDLSRVLDGVACVTNMTYRPVIYGHYSFGVCDFIRKEIIDRKCSSFTIFRDPYERAVSHYFFHRQYAYRHPEDHDTELPVNEWVKKFGSITWSNLPIHRNWKVTTEENGRKKCTNINNETRKTHWPKDELTMYEILNNLDKHLSFIGLFEDKPSTYKMLQEIYYLPFYDECLNIHQKVGSYEGLNATSQQELKRKAKQVLMKDKELGELMKFDVMLYEKAEKIFYAQKREFEKTKRKR